MAHKRTTPTIFYRAKELRRNLAPAERKLWGRLRNHQLNGLGFRRQHALGPFIVDFCCPERKVIIDVDGDSLASQVEYDKARTLWLRAHGWQVLHFTNGAVDGDIEGALEAIGEAFRSTEKSGAAR